MYYKKKKNRYRKSNKVWKYRISDVDCRMTPTIIKQNNLEKSGKTLITIVDNGSSPGTQIVFLV